MTQQSYFLFYFTSFYSFSIFTTKIQVKFREKKKTDFKHSSCQIFIYLFIRSAFKACCYTACPINNLIRDEIRPQKIETYCNCTHHKIVKLKHVTRLRLASSTSSPLVGYLSPTFSSCRFNNTFP